MIRGLRDRLRYVIEDMEIRAGQLERDHWYPEADLEREVAINAAMAALLKSEAHRLRIFVEDDERAYPDRGEPR